jgi:hypothetical protein
MMSRVVRVALATALICGAGITAIWCSFLAFQAFKLIQWVVIPILFG